MSEIKPMTVRLKDIEGVLYMLRIVGHESGVGSSYRGQANIDWPLLPKAGRPEHYLPDDRDLGMFR